MPPAPPNRRARTTVTVAVLDPSAVLIARKRRNWSQHRLGLVCGWSQDAISQVERGKLKHIRLDFALALRENLALDWDGVFGNTCSSGAVVEFQARSNKAASA